MTKESRPSAKKKPEPTPGPGREISGPAPRVPWRPLGLILAASLVLGLVCVFQYAKSPYFSRPILDEESYVQWAREIAAGAWLGGRVFYQDPLYPYFLAVVFKIFGESFLLVRLLQVALGVASVGLVFWTGSLIFGNRAGLLAAGMMALTGSLHFFELQLEKGTLVVFLSALACALGAAAGKNPRSKLVWLAAGGALGLLTMLRGNFLLVLPFLLAWAFLIERSDPRPARLARAALLAAGLAAVLGPVALRNYAVGKELVITTSQGGPNFFIGNNDRADGCYVVLPFVRPEPRYEAQDFQAEAERRSGHELSSAQVSRFWFKEGLTWIAAHPRRAFWLTLHKSRLLIHQFEVPDNHNFYLTRDVFVPALWAGFLGFGLLWGPALLGIFLRVRREPAAQFPALFALLYALSIIPFFILDRYRLALLPSLCVFAAGFFFLIMEKRSSRENRKLPGVAGLLAVSLLLGFWPTRESQAPRAFDEYNLGNTYLDAGRPLDALRWYDQAGQAMTDYPDLVLNRAVALLQLNSTPPPPKISAAEAKYRDPILLKDLAVRVDALKKPELAAGLYEFAAAKAPEAATFQELGRLYCSAPNSLDRKKGIDYLQRALALDPQDPRAASLLAECYSRHGRP